MDWYGTSHLGQDNLGHPTGPIGTSHWTNWDVPLDHCGTSNIDQDHLGHHRTCGNGRDVPLGHPILPKTIWNFPWTTWDVPLDQCGTSNIAQDNLGHPICPKTIWDFSLDQYIHTLDDWMVCLIRLDNLARFSLLYVIILYFISDTASQKWQLDCTQLCL